MDLHHEITQLLYNQGVLSAHSLRYMVYRERAKEATAHSSMYRALRELAARNKITLHEVHGRRVAKLTDDHRKEMREKIEAAAYLKRLKTACERADAEMKVSRDALI